MATKRVFNKEKDFEVSCGTEKQIFYDRELDMIDVCLGTGVLNAPCIRIYGTGKKVKDKPLLTLHLAEALSLKAIIDELIYDYHNDEIEKLSDKVIFKEE